MTKKCKTWYILFLITSILLNICPLAVYVIKAIIASDLVHEKIALSLSVFVVLIMTCISLVNKITLKSRLWIILLGLYFALDSIMTPLIIIAVCQIVDELICTPLKIHYKERYKINKEFDRRM